MVNWIKDKLRIFGLGHCQWYSIPNAQYFVILVKICAKFGLYIKSWKMIKLEINVYILVKTGKNFCQGQSSIDRKQRWSENVCFANYSNLFSGVCLFFRVFVDLVINLTNWETGKLKNKNYENKLLSWSVYRTMGTTGRKGESRFTIFWNCFTTKDCKCFEC